MSATVVVVGGGYGGIAVAQALDDFADVTLVDPKEMFVHNVATLRAFVNPDWIDKIFYPYDRLLKRGTVIRDVAVSVEPRAVWLASGKRIEADFIVLATGTTYPFPAKVTTQQVESAKLRMRRAALELNKAARVLLLGAGPVGLELAGEIVNAYPGRAVTILEPHEEVLPNSFVPGFNPDLARTLRRDLRDQAEAMGIQILTGTSLRDSLTTTSGVTQTFTASTWSRRQITADIWFQCFGRKPVSRYFPRAMSGAIRSDGRIKVTKYLQVVGQTNVFAIGDVTATVAPDTAVIAIEQAELVAKNIKAQTNGDQLDEFVPKQSMFLIPLGPNGGASYTPDDIILDAETTATYKGKDLFTGKYDEIFSNGPN